MDTAQTARSTRGNGITRARARLRLRQWIEKLETRHYEQGALWYKEANRECARIAIDDNVTVLLVCEMVAVLSPNCPWNKNLEAVKAVLRNRKVATSCYPSNVLKAKGMHEAFLNSQPFEVATGPKTRAFANALFAPESVNSVTLDTHMARIFYNRLLVNNQKLAWFFRKRNNAKMQEVFLQEAKLLNVNPNTLQAALWLCVKEELEKG